YGDALGHRGFSHSLLFAVIVAALAACAFRSLHATAIRAFLVVLIATASHGLLDTLTDGGRGVALLWPWSDTRFFAPFRPIEVSPIGWRFFSERGLSVLMSELLWVWIPCVIAACAIFGARQAFPRQERR